MKKCKHCNKIYNDTDRYCLKCNRPLVSISEEETKEILEENLEVQGKPYNTILWFSGLIALNVLFQVIYYFNISYGEFEFQWNLLFLGTLLYCIISLLVYSLSDRIKNPEVYEAIAKANEKARQENIAKLKRQAEEDKKYIPKCPTCGCENIRRISSTERGVNAAMFGIYGTKRKCQFECQNPNCKYRW